MVKLSTKIALSVWFVALLGGFVTSIVAVSHATLTIEALCPIVCAIGILGIITLVFAILVTLAWCNVKDGE